MRASSIRRFPDLRPSGRAHWSLASRAARSRLFILAATWLVFAAVLAAGPRRVVSLNGPWQFQREGAAATAWKTVTVPASFESHEGSDFDGVGWYRRQVEVPRVPAHHRLLLHFQGAATEAEVWCNGVKVGGHLGAWTPFRLDCTSCVADGGGGTAELKVRLDEKVGHNTQGFLPIVAPHFGGLWQEVQWCVVPEVWIDDLHLLAAGDPERALLQLEVPVLGQAVPVDPAPLVRYRLRGEKLWQEGEAQVASLASLASGGASGWRLQVPVAQAKLWQPGAPYLYEIEIQMPGVGGDVVQTRTGFRKVEARGTGLWLNGQPLSVRGVLNWGYSPPRTDPNPGEAWWRKEIALARDRGFNLMKLCLWIPPQRFLDLLDEEGLLAWMEYPTWHPTMTKKFLEPLQREFAEFHAFDRNHPSILFRSLTCETGSGAELDVIRTLYEQAHAMIPGALVEDDSSWIQWNRVTDFYDDHPYGNNHTWVRTLAELNKYIADKPAKPLVLGEAIAADTWVRREPLERRLGKQRPFWVPLQIDDQARWLAEANAAGGPVDTARLYADSLHYGWLMRKYQIETFRREVPAGGYVVSVIRDIPNAAMGLVDHLDQPKWTAPEWAWHGSTMLLLQTEADRRAFVGGTNLSASVLVSHFGPTALQGASVVVTLEEPQRVGGVLGLRATEGWPQPPGSLKEAAAFSFELPAVTVPTPLVVRAVLKDGQARHENHWPIWVVPPPAFPDPAAIAVHPSLSEAQAADLFPNSPLSGTATGDAAILVAARFDATVVQALEQGARVLMLPDGEKGSLPLSDHWFLRGAPWIPPHALSRTVPAKLLLELQHFDLASSVVPRVHYLAGLDPILMLWDTHDMKEVRTHGLVFETKVGRGRLLVSAIRHGGPANAAGRWLLGVLLEHLRHGAEPRHTLPDELWQEVKDKLSEDKLDLTERTWKFRPDPDVAGVAEGWSKPGLAMDDHWKDIRVGSAWEGQGFPNLDHWAWYRLAVRIPEHWRQREVYLSFEGVDDCYELFVNGALVGKGGDPVTKVTTFSERKSWKLTSLVKPGEEVVIAVRVYDWYGAGGIFRPVTLGTRPLTEKPDVIK